MYHYVREGSNNFPYSKHKSFSHFVQEIKELSASCDFATCSQINHSPPPNTIFLTFDDGLIDHLTVARYLYSQGIKATFFVSLNTLTNNSLLPVHKSHLITSHLGPDSYDVLMKLMHDQSLHLQHLVSTQLVHTHSDDAYKYQDDDSKIKSFKKLINYTGIQPLLDPLLDEILTEYSLSNYAETYYLSIKDLLEIISYGHEIGSHACSHTPLSSLSNSSQRHEISYSKIQLERLLSTPINSFCYPYGTPNTFNSTTISLLKESSYTSAWAVSSKDITHPLPLDYYSLPRFDCNTLNPS